MREDVIFNSFRNLLIIMLNGLPLYTDFVPLDNLLKINQKISQNKFKETSYIIFSQRGPRNLSPFK